MRTILTILLSMMLATASASEAWTAEKLPIAYLQDSTTFVSNPDSVLSPAACDSLNHLLLDLHRRQGVESIVVVVKRIEGGDPYEFGMTLARKYGVGSKKTNNGLIVVLSTEDRCYHILTGEGLEGVLPDATCRMIEARQMDPLLKQGDWDGAMLRGVRALCAEISQDPSLRPEEDDSGAWGAGLVGVGVAVGGVALLRRMSRKKCPDCNKRQMRAVKRRLVGVKENATTYEYTYRCKKCGHEETVLVDLPSGGSGAGAAGAAAGTILGSGRHYGGGGFRGGSFGGGSFGGGGAGGRF